MGDSTNSSPSPEFQVWPVLDLMAGKVVRGVAGNRSEYRPLPHASDPVQVVAKLCSEYESFFNDFYIADLDALQGQEIQSEAILELCATFPQIHFWIDAGFGTAEQVRRFCEELGSATLGQVSLIVATETLDSWSRLEWIVEASPVRLAFSLDLIHGVVWAKSDDVSGQSPEKIVERVALLGIRDVIVLDVAQVGIREGVSTLALCRRIVERFPAMRLVTGGGVRTIADLASIKEVGCRAALVATSLHDKSINASDLATLRDSSAG